MRLRLKQVFMIPVFVAVLGFAGVSFGALLGNSLNFPVIFYDSTGNTTYTASTGDLTILANPVSIRVLPSLPPRFITPTTTPPTGEKVMIKVKLDASGNLIGGVPGDDFIVVGEVDLDDDSIVDAAGVLLTG